MSSSNRLTASQKIFDTVLILMSAVLSLAAVQSVHAQETVGVADGEPAAFVVATVNIYPILFAQDGHTFTISFDAENRSGVQPGIRYGVVLGEATPEGFLTVDREIYDDSFTLRAGETVRKTITYSAPEVLEGAYTLYLVSENESGLKYAFQPLAEVTLERGEDASGVFIDPKTCSVAITGGTEQYTQGQLVHIGSGETLSSTCTVTNLGGQPVTVAPEFVTRERSAFGPLVEVQGGSTEVLTLAPKETRTVVVELPRATRAQLYDVMLAYGATGNAVTQRYVVRGGSATIENAIFDGAAYDKGDVAYLTVAWSPSADTVPGVRSGSSTELVSPSISIAVRGRNEQSCAEVLTQPIDAKTEPVSTIAIPMTAECVEPVALITLVDAVLGTLAERTYAVELPREEKIAPYPICQTPDCGFTVGFKPTASFWMSIIGLLIGLGLFGAASYRTWKDGRYTTPVSTVLLILLGVCSFGVDEASADTFLLSGRWGATHVVTVSMNKVEYAEGEDITLSGTTEKVSADVLASPYSHYSKIDASATTTPGTFNPNTPGILPFSYTITPNPPLVKGAHTLRFSATRNLVGVVMPFTVLNPPPELVATPQACGTGEIKLDWTANTVGSQLEIDGVVMATQHYPVDKDTPLGFGWMTYTHSGLAPNSNHSYRVREFTVVSGVPMSVWSPSKEAQAPGECVGPNFIASDVVMRPAGQTFPRIVVRTATYLEALVSNTGTQESSEPYIEVLFEKASDALGTNATTVGATTTPRLAPGESKVAWHRYVLPDSDNDTTRYFRACADYPHPGSISELDERDNCSPWTAVVIEPWAVADAGADQEITLPTSESQSSGATGLCGIRGPTGCVYGWTYVGGPLGASPTIEHPSYRNASATFKGMTVAGVYTFRLLINRDTSLDPALSDTDDMTVTVYDAPPPWGEISANPAVVDLNEPTYLTWDSRDVAGTCNVTGTNGDTWVQMKNGANIETSALANDTSFVLECDGKLIDGVFVTVNPEVTIVVDRSVITAGDSVEVSWDTNGNDEAMCDLIGKDVSAADFNGTGVGAKEIEIDYTSTFKLTCGGKSAETEVHVRPQMWEP